MKTLGGAFWIAATVALTIYGQLAFKWRANLADEFPAGLGPRVEYVARLLADPWIISVFASALLASATWWAALRSFDLSFAYPFMALSFVGVLLLSGLFFDEDVTLWKLGGVGLVVVGLTIGSRG